MSTTTLVNLDAPKLHDPYLSFTPTPARNSLDTPAAAAAGAREMDPEKLAETHDDSEGEETPQLSTLRMSLLVMGLTLSIFLVALDFVISHPTRDSELSTNYL